MTESDDSWEQHSFDEEELYSDQDESSSESDSSSAGSSYGEDGDSEGDEAHDEIRGVEPYRYESIVAPDEVVPEGVNEGDPNRLLNTDWCTCGKCIIQPCALNNICCKEVEKIVDKMTELEADIQDPNQCLTLHPWFEACCLHPVTLQTAHMQYQTQYGRHAVEGTIDQKFRHVAYRQVVRWCWGYLGRSNRVPLPSCVMDCIHRTYPNPDGQYKGFKYPPLD